MRCGCRIFGVSLDSQRHGLVQIERPAGRCDEERLSTGAVSSSTYGALHGANIREDQTAPMESSPLPNMTSSAG